MRRSTIMTATFAGLQNISCTEARQGRSALRQISNPGEVAAVPSRNTSGLQYHHILNANLGNVNRDMDSLALFAGVSFFR